jgi:transposase-like protein
VSETRKYRQFSPDQKAETVLAGLRGDRAVRDVCGEYEIAETSPRRCTTSGASGFSRGEGGAGQSAGEDRGAHRDRRAAPEGRLAGTGAGAQDLRAGGRGEALRGWE